MERRDALRFFLIQMQCILEDQFLEASYRGSHHQFPLLAHCYWKK